MSLQSLKFEAVNGNDSVNLKEMWLDILEKSWWNYDFESSLLLIMMSYCKNHDPVNPELRGQEYVIDDEHAVTFHNQSCSFVQREFSCFLLLITICADIVILCSS